MNDLQKTSMVKSIRTNAVNAIIGHIEEMDTNQLRDLSKCVQLIVWSEESHADISVQINLTLARHGELAELWLQKPGQ